MEGHEVTEALTEHARTLGWEITEWDWKDSDDEGYDEYQVWMRPIDGKAAAQ